MKKLFIELADTSEKRELGLMHRKHLPKDQGMLFKFQSPTFASFWMKNTYIPLDIAFIDSNGKILQIESMSPLSTKSIYSNNKCKYALEVNKGWFSNNNISVGAKIDGHGIINQKKTAQNNLQLPINQQLTEENEGEEQKIEPKPDIMLNLTNKEVLENANIKNEKLLIIYQTKSGLTLPPKIISPPFEFEKDSKQHHDAIVKAWDEQTGGWKSFLIDNILKIEKVQ